MHKKRLGFLQITCNEKYVFALDSECEVWRRQVGGDTQSASEWQTIEGPKYWEEVKGFVEDVFRYDSSIDTVETFMDEAWERNR